MTDPRIPVNIEVKCAICGSYFRLDKVTKYKNGYYCRYCYPYRNEPQRARQDREASGEARCTVCGKALAPEGARVLYSNNTFCIACYDKSTPYLDARPFWTQPSDAVAAMRTDRFRCCRCNRDLGPLDVKVRDGELTYCEGCYRDAREAAGKRRFHIAEQAGINTRPGVTVLRDSTNVVECAYCGWVITRDKLEASPKGSRGKPRCPHCGKKMAVPPEKLKEIRCEVCGKALTPYDTRVQGGGKSYCQECYDKSIEYQHCGTGAAKAEEKKIVCSVCGRSDMQRRWVLDGKVYCDTCHGNPKNGAKKKDEPATVDSAFSRMQGVTTVEDPSKLITCPSCGIVLTRDRLKENKQGKPCCPKCDWNLAPLISVPLKSRAEDYSPIAQLFKCLGDPCRIKIIESLSEKELCVFEFVELTGYQYSALSYHLKTLKEMNLIKSFERGNFMVYSLTDKGQVIHDFIKRSRELNGEIWQSENIAKAKGTR